jgi:hypothetical protein
LSQRRTNAVPIQEGKQAGPPALAHGNKSLLKEARLVDIAAKLE